MAASSASPKITEHLLMKASDRSTNATEHTYPPVTRRDDCNAEEQYDSRASAGGMHVITRRLFLIFVSFALLPVIVLSGIAIVYVADAAQRQVEETLMIQNRVFADQTMARLSAAERYLRLARGELLSSDEPLSKRWKSSELLNFSTTSVSYMPASFLSNSLDAERITHLGAGRAILLRRLNPSGVDSIYMAMLADPTQPIKGSVVMRITENYIFGEPELRDLRHDNCVYGSLGLVLLATNNEICDAFDTTSLEHKGSLQASPAGTPLTLVYREIFLNENFRMSSWWVGIASPDADILRESTLFGNTFLGIAILLLLVLSLLSTRLIRRQMLPLNAIMSGIKRAARQHYDQPVLVSSGDEFEAVANAFNDMSNRVSHQLTTMASMSEIDRLILSRGKKEDIIRIVLFKMGSVLPGDHFALMLFDDKDSTSSQMYRQNTGAGSDLLIIETTVTADNKSLIARDEKQVHSGEHPKLCGLIKAIRGDIHHKYQFVPINSDGQLIGAMVVGFQTQPTIDEQSWRLASSFADRIAVGLTNAEWEETLFHQANFDSLTNLLNRPALISELHQRIARAQREKLHFGMIFIDLDNFKLVNDSLGHDQGDQLIAAIATRLLECVREGEIVARLGGDEFIVLTGESHSAEESAAACNTTAIRLLKAIQRPLALLGTELRNEASLGIALFPDDGTDPNVLMRNADTAMYHAKSEGRARIEFYSKHLNDSVVTLMRLSSELKQALERNEFTLYYQAKVCAQTRRIVGAEALIRWQHPERGHMKPDEFLGPAQKLGMMNMIGEWVLENALEQIATWRQQGRTTVPISINVETSQIQLSEFVDTVTQQLDRFGLTGEDLEIEVTEGMLIDNLEASISTLNQLRCSGIKISIDDYGTGYSSMNYMKQLPIDKLKIDRSFIINLTTDRIDQAIVTSTIALAESLGMGVVAEGVENQQQAILLEEYGCDELQGYLFSRPLCALEFAKLLDADLLLRQANRTST